MAAEKQAIELRHSTGGVFDNVDRLAAALKVLGAKHHIISPGGAIGGTLPMLHSVAVSFVFADPEADGYPIPGGTKRGVGKAILEQIGSAAGVRWIPAQCGQVDEWNDPHRVKYQSAAVVQQLDGTERLIVASKVVDLRADKDAPVDTWGSDAQEIARIAAAKKDRNGNPAPRDPWPEILGARRNIHANAETKSRLRALRSLGVKTAYEPDEMKKGWAILRLQFTGRHDDPAVERMVAEKIADRALSASGMLFGSGARQALPAAASLARRARPLPETVEPESDEDGVVLDAELVEHDATPTDDTAPDIAAPDIAAPDIAAPQAAGDSLGWGASPAPQGPPRPSVDPDIICGPKGEDGYPRKPCSQFSVEQLKKKIAYAERARPTWEPKWAAKNEAELRAMQAWLVYLSAQPKPVAEDEVPF